jgi:uncharacterized membrane protein YesL
MIGFLIKKTFFDLWDNLFRLALINVGFVAFVAIPVFLPPLIPVAALSIAVLAIGVLWCFVYFAAASLCIRKISDYSVFGFRDFFESFKVAWPSGLVMGGIATLAGLLVAVVIPFYIGMDSIIGVVLAVLVFWFLITGILAFQFFFSFRARMDNPMAKSIKKCFIIFFDNPGFCIFSLIHNIILLAISIFLAFLIPGPAGIMLFLDEGLRLRLLKYDWLEAHPEAGKDGKRPKIPWDELLIDDRENTGTRTFKNFIFPWKD